MHHLHILHINHARLIFLHLGPHIFVKFHELFFRDHAVMVGIHRFHVHHHALRLHVVHRDSGDTDAGQARRQNDVK